MDTTATLQFEAVAVTSHSDSKKKFSNLSIEITQKAICIGSKYKIKWKNVDDVHIFDAEDSDVIGFALRCFVLNNNTKKTEEDGDGKEESRLFEVFGPLPPCGARDVVSAWHDFQRTLTHWYENERQKRTKKHERREDERPHRPSHENTAGVVNRSKELLLLDVMEDADRANEAVDADEVGVAEPEQHRDDETDSSDEEEDEEDEDEDEDDDEDDDDDDDDDDDMDTATLQFNKEVAETLDYNTTDTILTKIATMATSKREKELAAVANGRDDDGGGKRPCIRLASTTTVTVQQAPEETEKKNDGSGKKPRTMATRKRMKGETAVANETQSNDVLTINAGGKLITAMRSTLTIPNDSMWAYMFSGRWEDSLTRDDEGRIFLDYDYDLIETIVNYLREKNIEDPSDPLTFPYILPHKKKSFERMLRYFGLTEFFGVEPNPASDNNIDTVLFSKNNFVQYKGGSLVTVTDNDTGIHTCRLCKHVSAVSRHQVKLVYKNEINGHYCIACTTELDPSGDGVFWKVKLEKIPRSWLFLGIAGNLDLPAGKGVGNTIRFGNKSYGWTESNTYAKGKSIGRHTMCASPPVPGRHPKQVVVDSRVPGDGNSAFSQGEILYFSLKSNKLQMHQRNKTFVIDIDTNHARKFYFHIGLCHDGATLTLEPLDAQERAVFD